MKDAEFSGLVTKYEKLVYTICYQLCRDHHTAQDLAQETFLSAYSHIASCPQGSERPWLARIATNKAKDHLKSAYNRKMIAADHDTMPEDKGALFMQEALPEDITLSRETVAHIQQDILALKEPYHKVATLYFMEEMSVDEIAIRLSRPPKTVHTQIYRAKKMLQQKLKGGILDDVI